MNIEFFFLFSIAAITLYLFFYIETHDVLNPPGAMVTIWLFMAGICHLDLGTYQKPWCTKTYIVIIVATCSMTLTGYCVLKNKSARKKLMKKRSDFNIEENQRTSFYHWFYLWVGICFICLIINMRENQIPLTYVFTHSLSGNKGVWRLSSNILVKYFTCMFPYCAIISFYILLFKKKISCREKILNIIIVLVSLFVVLFVMVSRGTAIIPLLGFIYVLHRKNHFSIVKLGQIFGIVLTLFGVYALFRWSDHSSELAVYSGRIQSPLFNSIYNYIVYCYQNLDTLIREGSPMTIYKYNLPQISKLLGIYNAEELKYISVAGFNACTYLVGAYHDLGMLGVIGYSTLSTFIVTWLYNLSNRNESYTIPLAMLQRGIMTRFFGEYIFLLNGQSLPIVIAVILIWMTSRRSKVRIVIRRSMGQLCENESV